MTIRAGVARPRRAAGLAVMAAALLAQADVGAQERRSRAFECEGENACRVRCLGVADVARVLEVVIEEAPWDPKTLMLTVTHEHGVATLLLRGDARCRMDNLRAVR